MNSPVEGQNTPLPDETFEVNGFRFNKAFWSTNPVFGMTLVIAADPSPLQKQVLQQLDVVILDEDGKQFFPREDASREKSPCAGEPRQCDTKIPGAGGGLARKFCPAPFVRFDTLLDGTVACCCSNWIEERLGSIDSQSLAEIWNGPVALKIRESIHDGSFRYCRADRCTYLLHGTLPDKTEVTDPYLRKVIAEKAVVMEQNPTSLMLAHDVSCNLACPSCRSGVLKPDLAQQSRLEVVERTVFHPLLTPGRRITLTVSGQGDPWASPHYRSLLKYVANRRDLTLDLVLNTNGLLVNEKLWDEFSGLEQYHPLVNVSIDACHPWTYRVLRHPGRWEVLKQCLEFIAAKRRDGALSAFVINATVQLDNFHELRSMLLLAKGLGCDAMRLYMILNTGSHLDADFERKNIANPKHPLHQAFLDTLRDAIFDDPVAHLFDVDAIRAKAIASPSVFESHRFCSPAECIAQAGALRSAGQLGTAFALLSRARWMFPEQIGLRGVEGQLLQEMGYPQLAAYRYREYLAGRPEAAAVIDGLDNRPMDLSKKADALGGLVRACEGLFL